MECPIIPDELRSTREFPSERVQLINLQSIKKAIHHPSKLCESNKKIDLKIQENKNEDKYFYLKKFIDQQSLFKQNFNSVKGISKSKIKNNLREAKNEKKEKSWSLGETILNIHNGFKSGKKFSKRFRTPTNRNRKVSQRHSTAFLTVLLENKLKKECPFQPISSHLNYPRKCFEEFYQDQVELEYKKNTTLQQAKDKIEEKLKKELTFTPKICHNSEKIFKKMTKDSRINAINRLYQIKTKCQSFDLSKRDNEIFPNKKLKSIYLSSNKIQRSQSFTLKPNMKKKQLIKFELKRKTDDLAFDKKQTNSKFYQKERSREKNSTYTYEKKPIYTLSRSDEYILNKFKQIYDRKYKTIIGDCKELNLISDEKSSKNRIDFLYELIFSFPNIKMKSLIFLHLIAILQINIPREKYSQELLYMFTKKIKDIYGDIYLYFDFLHREFITFYYNYNSIFYQRKNKVNNDLEDSCSYLNSKRKKESSTESHANFSNRLLALRQEFFKKILDQKVKNMYKDLDPMNQVKRNINVSSTRMSKSHSLFHFSSKTINKPNLFSKENIVMKEKIQKILRSSSSKYHVNDLKTYQNINKTTTRNDSSRKSGYGKVPIDIKNVKANEMKLDEKNLQFSNKVTVETNNNKISNSNSNLNCNRDTLKGNDGKMVDSSKYPKRKNIKSCNSLTKFIQKNLNIQFNNNNSKKQITKYEICNYNLDPKDEITNKIKNRTSQKLCQFQNA